MHGNVDVCVIPRKSGAITVYFSAIDRQPCATCCVAISLRIETGQTDELLTSRSEDIRAAGAEEGLSHLSRSGCQYLG